MANGYQSGAKTNGYQSGAKTNGYQLLFNNSSKDDSTDDKSLLSIEDEDMKSLKRTDEHIKRALMLTAEAKATGATTLEELDRQEKLILDMTRTVEGVDNKLNTSDRTIVRIMCRTKKQKIITAAIILVLLAIIIMILIIKFH